jgi:ribosomal peptide maturation radical SAM protein 1
VKVLLVSMPFTAIERPALGLSILKARLQEGGVACDVAYLSLVFASRLGRDVYESVVHDVPYTSLACEWAFRSALFGPSPLDEEYVDELQERWLLPRDLVDRVLEARDLAERFIITSVAERPWADYDVVGFSTVGQQNLASLALARAVRERAAKPVLVFGGHAWEEPMGRELLLRFPFVDFAISGEGDDALPALVAALAGRASLRDVPGLIYRDGSRAHMRPARADEVHLAESPLPDHSEYFVARRDAPEIDEGPLTFPIEASRGCWWASRHACAFCGLSGSKRVYRSKSPGAVLGEIRSAATRWPQARIDMVDNVVPDTFLDEVLPRLAAERLPVGFAFAVRPGVRKEHVRDAASIRTALQCGVESLSDGVLRLMHKGTRGLENVRLLRWCREFGVDLDWNLLYAVPGESAADYRHVMDALPWIRFLQPPDSCAPVQVERFSAYFSDPDAFGFRNMRPARAYHYVYPFGRAASERVAYFFDFDRPSESGRPGWIQHLRSEVKGWQREPDEGALTWEEAGDHLVLRDSRGGRSTEVTRLSGGDRRLMRQCEDISDLATLCSLDGLDTSEADAVRARLRDFQERGWVVSDGDRYLSLAIPAPSC